MTGQNPVLDAVIVDGREKRTITLLKEATTLEELNTARRRKKHRTPNYGKMVVSLSCCLPGYRDCSEDVLQILCGAVLVLRQVHDRWRVVVDDVVVNRQTARNSRN